MFRIPLLLVALSLVFCAHAVQAEAVNLAKDVKLEKLNPTTWIHTTYKHVSNFGNVPSNGVIKILDEEVLIVDTAWTNEQTDLILDWIASRGLKVKAVIVTHSHDDRMGGLHAVHKRGIHSIAHSKTVLLATQKGLEVPKQSFDQQYSMEFSGAAIELYYPGPGHTVDNITVWFEKDKLLFGGCLIKSLNAIKLGYIKEADLGEWGKSVKRLQDKYPVATVVPGHGLYGGEALLQHTIDLIQAALKKIDS